MTRLWMSVFVIVLCFVGALPAVAATPKLFDFLDPKGMNAVSLSIDAPWEPVVGYADGISGTADFDPAHPEATTGKIIADVSSVRFSNEGYTNTARNYALQQKKFPQVICELKKIKTIKTVRPGVYTGTVDVNFTCHGVTKLLTVPLSVTYLPGVSKQRFPDFEGDLLVIRCNFVIHRADFGIAKDVPADSVAEDVAVRVAIVGTEKKRTVEATPAKPIKKTPTTLSTPNDIPITVDGKTYTLAERMAFYHVPGASVAFIRNFQVQWVKNSGEAAKGKAITDKTLYMAGSMGEPLVVAAALKASETGQLSLDAPIESLLKSWQVPNSPLIEATRPITVRDLLTHLSGFGRYKYDGYLPGGPIPTITQVLKGEKPAQTPPVVVATAPGTEFHLAAENYVILQQIAEDVSKRSFNDLLRELIFSPLGMTQSRFTIPGTEVAAIGHDEKGEPIPGGWRVYPEAAASGLWTTAREYAQCLAELMRTMSEQGGTYLKPETAKLLTLPIPESKDSVQTMGFGIGTHEGIPYYYRGGNAEGYFCMLNADIEQGDAIVIFTNRNLSWALTNEIRDSVARSEKVRGYVSE